MRTRLKAVPPKKKKSKKTKKVKLDSHYQYKQEAHPPGCTCGSSITRC